MVVLFIVLMDIVDIDRGVMVIFIFYGSFVYVKLFFMVLCF